MITETQRAVLVWLANGETGVSSETLAFSLAFDVRKEGNLHPHDPSDFNRCLNLLETAPALRPKLGKMSGVSPEWARLVANWDEIEKMFLDEVGLDWAKGTRLRATKTFHMMKAVIDASPPCVKAET